MSSFRKALCWIYAAIALTALVATWSQNMHYFGGAQAGGGGHYIPDLKANPAARSFTVDIGFFLLSATFLMALEARRLGVRWVWAYVLLGFAIAISVTFPLFLIARERRLAWLQTQGLSPAGDVKLTLSDAIGLAATTALVLGFAGYILS